MTNLRPGRKGHPDYSEVRGDDLERIVHRLLNSHFWPRQLKHSTRYSRLHDDHDGTYQGRITVTFGEDSDAWVEISGREAVSDGLRFRMPMIGGGASPRVRTALLLLAEAIRLDNEERPLINPALKTQPTEGTDGRPAAARCPGFRPPRDKPRP